VTAQVPAVRGSGSRGRREPAAPTVAHVAPHGAATNREQSLRTGALARRADPAAMSPEARLAELGGFLATGLRRHQLSLAGSRQPEAQCQSMGGAFDSNNAGVRP
jgi:hypothetical protein